MLTANPNGKSALVSVDESEMLGKFTFEFFKTYAPIWSMEAIARRENDFEMCICTGSTFSFEWYALVPDSIPSGDSKRR